MLTERDREELSWLAEDIDGELGDDGYPADLEPKVLATIIGSTLNRLYLDRSSDPVLVKEAAVWRVIEPVTGCGLVRICLS